MQSEETLRNLQAGDEVTITNWDRKEIRTVITRPTRYDGDVPIITTEYMGEWVGSRLVNVIKQEEEK